MFPPSLSDICRLSLLSIIGELKRSGGLAIPELAERLDMSYMGIKQHCVNLEKGGYLKGWREPRGASSGRPRKIYLLTDKCDAIFPDGGDDLLLDLLSSVKASFGEAAPEKLLYQYFEKRQIEWIDAVKSSKTLIDKASKFADVRMKAGHFCQCHYSAETGFIIEEYHHPLHLVLAEYPGLIVLETRMIEQALAAKVVRSIKSGPAGVECTVYEINES